ncbi:hypothetical protein HQN87_11050 [Paenibacillus tritici]|uniref:Polysaccharide biosynthesis protein n=1 Tax=Paenibacillus tritici TaxID=1873425 RepID=A0ABX2DML5_9BACL|nr:hypothetical protein [Paenibacillus tritici]NQX45870.1 hypothetical protein [Paenibacillus tritici]
MTKKSLNFLSISLFRNFSYSISSNLVTLFVSTLLILIVPKIVGVEQYGYWQLYLFYSSYVGFLHFGWNDGIYLRYGGKEYSDLDKKLFFSQFYMLLIFQFIISIILFTGINVFMSDINRIYVLNLTIVCMIITNIRLMLSYILQVTNKIKEYAFINVLDRISYCLLLGLFLLIGITNYKLIIVADLFGKFFSLIIAMYFCKEIVIGKLGFFYLNVSEAKENIKAGIKLMLANIASLLIVGVTRFGIERAWDVSTFAKVSLTFSISNLLMLFINAIGTVLFPMLRRTSAINLPIIYKCTRDILMFIMFGALLVYYPLKYVLLGWLPKYEESFIYLALLFPMCIFEGKIALLINTYLKTLRKEKVILKINIISLGLSVLITYFTTTLLKNLNLAVLSIVLILAFRCVAAELVLSKSLKISINKDILLELTLSGVFVFIGWFANSWYAFLIYLFFYILYLILKKKDILSSFSQLKLLLKS